MKWLAVAATIVVLAAAAAAAALLLASRDSSSGSAGSPPAGPYRGSRPPAGIRAPDFTLRDYRGQTVRMASLRGRIVLTTFLDSACHDTCPIILARLARGLRLLDPQTRRSVTALAITVNPPVDTPTHVRRFLLERGALGQIDYLLGSVRRLRPTPATPISTPPTSASSIATANGSRPSMPPSTSGPRTSLTTSGPRSSKAADETNATHGGIRGYAVIPLWGIL